MRLATWKRWAILIVVLGLIVGAGVFGWNIQVNNLARSVAKQADEAAAKGDFQTAERLYGEHLIVFPNDDETKIKLADVILKVAPSPDRQSKALQIYGDVLKRPTGRGDVRRKQMELKFKMGRLISERGDGADADLIILLQTEANKTDGRLNFLMGQCCEEGKDYSGAKKWYQAAIKHNAREKLEAYQRLANLLRAPDRLNDPKAADQLIEEMVRSSPENYVVYLERGRYRRRFKLPDSRSDFEKALKLADDKPEIYLELANLADVGGYDEAKKVLEDGLEKLPASAELYIALADLEQRGGHADQAIQTLELGLKSPAEKTGIRWSLARILASRGDTGKLRLQIEELKNAGVAPVFVQYLEAYFYANSSDFRKARQLLVPLESAPGLPRDFKATISDLLARCHGELGEPLLQREALIRARGANPNDLQARLGLIDLMIKQGDIDEAIKEYRELVKVAPSLNVLLAQQLIARNLQRPAPQRNWSEVTSVIDDAEKALPQSIDPLIVRADSLIAQDQDALARDVLAKARSRFPKSVSIRCAQAGLMVKDKQFIEAQHALDEALKELGDSVELRFQRAKLVVAKGGPQVVGELNALSQNLGPLSRADQRRLLTALALEFVRLQDPVAASGVWSRLAEQEPNDVDLRLNVLEMAFQTANTDEIDKTIKQIERIEGPDGSLGPLCHVQYLIWQAERASDKDPEEARRLRTKARASINELVARRADWYKIPMAQAQLEKQELREAELGKGNLTAREIYDKEENIIGFYRRAIDLGQFNSAIVLQTLKLLYKHQRGSEAFDLVNSIPVPKQLASDLGRRAASFAVENRDFERAEDFARRAVAANPADFQERILLSQILLFRGRQAEAETVIREAVDLSKGDPDRWIMLVQFLARTKQQTKAAQAVKDAEASLPDAQAPLALAQCCFQVGKSYDGTNEGEKKQWYSRAREWYEKAIAAHPNDLAMVRRLTDFFVETRQMSEVEAQLKSILKGPQDAETKAWARRTLALALAASPDPKRVREALSILEPPAPAGQGAKPLEDPDDFRVLARVLEAQGTVEHRKRAIRVLESLVAKNIANIDDRLRLAVLDEASGDWPKALEVYRDLNLRTKNPRDLETLNRRSAFLAQFTRSLLRNHKAGNDQELMDAQDLGDELARTQPDDLNTLVLRFDVYRARNQMNKAAELIETTSRRPNLSPAALKELATRAEKSLNRIDIAEALYRQYAALLNTLDGKVELARFLSRHGRAKDGVDILEPLWKQAVDPEQVARAATRVSNDSNPPDPTQVERVARWLEQALERKKDSTFLLADLANLREQQMRFDDAKALYQSVIKQVPGIAIAQPKANEMLAVSYNNLAMLTALKDGEAKTALVDINHAIDLVGPIPDFLDTRGVIHLGLKQTKDAISDLETAAKTARSPGVLFHLAQAYFQANDKEKAKQCLREAKAKGIHVGLGGLHFLEEPAYRKLQAELGLL